MNRFIIQKGMDRQAVLYWYQGRSRVVASELANKAWLMLDAARLRRTDGGLVRLITPVSSTPADAFAGVDDVLVRPVSVSLYSTAMRISRSDRPGGFRAGARLSRRPAPSRARGPRPRHASTVQAGMRIRKQQFKEAVIEYRRALAAVPNDAAVRYKLGRVYQDSGNLLNAYTEYARAGDLDPANVDAQMRAGTILLLGREFEAARTRAELALKADPNHAPAHILLGNAKAGLERDRGSDAPDPGGHQSRPLVRAGVDGARRGHVHWRPQSRSGGGLQESGRARATVDRSHGSRSPTTSGRPTRFANAERTLKSALAIDAQNAAAHRALALLYITTGRRPEADRISARSRSTPRGGWRSPTTTWASGGTPMR